MSVFGQCGDGQGTGRDKALFSSDIGTTADDIEWSSRDVSVQQVHAVTPGWCNELGRERSGIGLSLRHSTASPCHMFLSHGPSSFSLSSTWFCATLSEHNRLSPKKDLADKYSLARSVYCKLGFSTWEQTAHPSGEPFFPPRVDCPCNEQALSSPSYLGLRKTQSLDLNGQGSKEARISRVLSTTQESIGQDVEACAKSRRSRAPYCRYRSRWPWSK